MSRTSLIARCICGLVLGVLFTCFAGTAYAAKDVFIRSKPHVNVGTVEGAETSIWLHANVHIDPTDGTATGPIQIHLETGEHLIYHAVSARFVVEQGATRVLLTLRVAAATPQSEDRFDLVIIRPDPTISDCLIYDFVGPNVHVQAPGTISL
jgi:hypothetical protein